MVPSSSLYGLALCMIGLLTAATTSGCAAVEATRQPGKKDLSVLSTGTPRTHVIAELGAPTWSDERAGDIVDVFSFKQGYTKGVKAGRALVHGAADVATFGLWEVVGIPAEMLADGTDVRVEVHYDPQQSVRKVEVIKGQKVFEQPKLAAWWERHKKSKASPAEVPAEADGTQWASGSRTARETHATAASFDAGDAEVAIEDTPVRPSTAPCLK